MEIANPKLERAIKQTRKDLLDILEVAFGLSPRWPLVRERVLEIFGRKGLQKFVANIDLQIGDEDE